MLKNCLRFRPSRLSFFTRYKSSVTQKPTTDIGPQHCLKLVQQNDHENFLCTLLMKNDERRDAFALRALNVEISKCNSNASDESVANLRLKFWYDAIDKCYAPEKSYVTDHPVLRELRNTIQKHNLSKLYLKRLVNARERSTNKPFETLEEMEVYSEKAFSSLYNLLVECKDIKDLNVDHAVSHLGKAQGITSLLRAIPHKGRKEALNIPTDLLLKHGVSAERILRHNGDDKQVADCVFEVAATAFEHLKRARILQHKVPPSARNILLPAIAVDRYLERLRKANFRLTDPSVMQRDNLLPMSLYWHEIRGKY